MRKKQCLALLLALALLTGCGAAAPAGSAAPETPIPSPTLTPEPTPTPLPTAEPSPAPVSPEPAEPSPELPAGDPPEPTDSLPAYTGPFLTEQPPVDEDYFADAAFFGNSLVAGLSMFGGIQAHFVAATSVNVTNAAVMKAEGSEATLLQLLCSRKFRKLYTLFGINEIGFEPDYFAKLYEQLIDKILSVEPDCAVYVMGLTPVTREQDEKGDVFCRERVLAYNEALKDLAARRQWYYVDLIEALAGPDGYLPEEESTDGIHLTKEKYPDWSACLRTHYAPETVK